eukprot:gene17020-26115_t
MTVRRFATSPELELRREPGCGHKQWVRISKMEGTVVALQCKVCAGTWKTDLSWHEKCPRHFSGGCTLLSCQHVHIFRARPKKRRTAGKKQNHGSNDDSDCDSVSGGSRGPPSLCPSSCEHDLPDDESFSFTSGSIQFAGVTTPTGAAGYPPRPSLVSSSSKPYLQRDASTSSAAPSESVFSYNLDATPSQSRLSPAMPFRSGNVRGGSSAGREAQLNASTSFSLPPAQFTPEHAHLHASHQSLPLRPNLLRNVSASTVGGSTTSLLSACAGGQDLPALSPPLLPLAPVGSSLQTPKMLPTDGSSAGPMTPCGMPAFSTAAAASKQQQAAASSKQQQAAASSKQQQQQ